MVREQLVKSVLEVKSMSDRLMVMKLEVKGSILNIISTYAPKVNNSIEEKNNFWQDLDGLIESVSKLDRIVLGADLNGHVGKENIDDEEIMGRYSVETRNKGRIDGCGFCHKDGFGSYQYLLQEDEIE